MDADLSEAEFDAAIVAAGVALTAEERRIVLAEARNLHRAAALARDYVADAERDA